MYTHSTILDYPSISQVNLKVKQNAINVIFAVTQEQHGVYERLSKHVEGSTSAILSNDSSNVVELIKEQYSVSSLQSLVHTPGTVLNCSCFVCRKSPRPSK